MLNNVTAYRLANLRSIKDSGEVSLPPLSILVGRNGSGKSSFMRFFQILQQSTKVAKRSPLLFFGDDVDFGSFEESICKVKNTDDFIGFGFSFDYTPSLMTLRRLLGGSIKGKIFCKIKSHKEKTYLSSVEGDLFGDKFCIEFFDKKINKIVINEIDFSEHCSKFICIEGFITPDIVRKDVDDRFFVDTYEYHPRYRSCIDVFVKAISHRIHGRTKESTKYAKAVGVKYTEKEEFIKQLSKLFDSTHWDKFITTLSQDTKAYNEIRSSFVLTYLPTIVFLANDALNSIARSIYYVGPSRAHAQRYYRIQELDVSKIDPSGYNTPVFINNLTATELTSFKTWTKDFFGFEPTKNTSSGHISILISESKQDFNLSDVGFGYSQILPILIQLWQFTNNFKKMQTSQRRIGGLNIFFMEQPELHLHPAFQKNIVKAILHTIKESRTYQSNLKIIIETHSEYIINEVGKAIELGDISEEMASVYLFEKNDGVCSISQSKFDKNGCLLNWPFGFFSGE